MRTTKALFATLGIALLAVACGGSEPAADDESGQGALTNHQQPQDSCTELSSKPCTPAAGSAARQAVIDTLRAHVIRTLEIPSSAGEFSFVFDDFRLQSEEKQAPAFAFAYVRGKMVTKSNNDVMFKLPGANAGKRPVFEALVMTGMDKKVLELDMDTPVSIAKCWRRYLDEDTPGEYFIGPTLIPGTTDSCPKRD